MCVCVYLCVTAWPSLCFDEELNVWWTVDQDPQASWLHTLTLDEALNCIFWDNQLHCVSYACNSTNTGCRNGRGRRVAGDQSVILSVSSHLLTSAFQKQEAELNLKRKTHLRPTLSKTKRSHLHVFNQPHHVVIHSSFFSSSLILLLWLISIPQDIYTSWNSIFGLRLFLLQKGVQYKAL